MISDAADERIAVFLGLRDHVARQRREQPGGDMAAFFIAEGDLVIERALAAGHDLRSVLIAAGRSKPLPAAIPATTPVYEAGGAVLAEITGRPELRDPLACFVRPDLPEPGALIADHATFVVMEGINNPNNLGVIMRNAAGLGIGAALLDPTCGDPLYRRAIRASMGQVFAVPHGRTGPMPGALGAFHDAGVATVALSPAAPDPIDTVLRRLGRGRVRGLAIVLGAEGPGLTDTTLAATTHRARIPMSRDVDSLNVASAAAIAFHSLTRLGPDAEPGQR